MKIAVNTRLLLKNKLEGIGWFTFETLKRITQNHSEHEFYFIFDREYSSDFIFSKNVHPIVIGPQSRHPFLFYWWFERSIPKILKKINADLFISPDGFLSLSTKVKSLAVFHDINYMHYPKDFPFLVRHYYRYFSPRFAKKADRIVTVSEFSKKDIVDQFSINPELVDVVYNGANKIYKPISEEEKQATKQKYTSGNDYFIFVGALSPRKNIANLLLAFDRFKTQTFSTAKLIIVGEMMFKTQRMKRAYSQLVYKDDVIFTGRMSPEELRYLYGSAIALTFVPYFEGFGIPIIEAMNCHTPVITSNVTSMPEVAGDAALLVNPFSVDSIADAMTRLFADDKMRKELITRGSIQCQKFSWDITAEKFWESIEKTIK
ncbi:MAG: glycosyltransferase [Bacteroidetes bacterium GWF2_33_16]|nr:MAG: glycosyltransferase [Bacteroidetes bacterium GWE2_32_14]OFY04189.1 MAG: glycosyltransferase [Bacteroidetes bacterium GWF2_33_16]